MVHNKRYGHGNLFWPKIWMSCGFRRAAFSVQLSAHRFQRGRFDAEVSAWSFRQGHIVFFGQHKLSSLESTHSLIWQAHIVLVAKDTLSSLERTHCLLWKQTVLCRNEKKNKIKMLYSGLNSRPYVFETSNGRLPLEYRSVRPQTL